MSIGFYSAQFFRDSYGGIYLCMVISVLWLIFCFLGWIVGWVLHSMDCMVGLYRLVVIGWVCVLGVCSGSGNSFEILLMLDFDVV